MPPLAKHRRSKLWLIVLGLSFIFSVILGLGMWAILGERTRVLAKAEEDAKNWALVAEEAVRRALERQLDEGVPVIAQENTEVLSGESGLLVSRYESARSLIRDGNGKEARGVLLELRADPTLRTVRSGAGLPLEALVLRAQLDVCETDAERLSVAEALRVAVLRDPSPLSRRLMEDLLPHLPGIDRNRNLQYARDAEEALRLAEAGLDEWNIYSPWIRWNSRYWYGDFSRAGTVSVVPLERLEETVEEALLTLKSRLPAARALRVSWYGREVFNQDELSEWIVLAAVASGPLATEVITGSDHMTLASQRTAWLWWLLALVLLVTAIASWFTWNAFDRQEKLANLQSEFIASVSHELRTPVASIGVLAERLESTDSMDAEKASEYHTMIARESRRMAALVDNVLDFSRIEQGKKEYEFEPADLPRLVRETTRMLRPYAQEKELDLREDIHEWSEDDLPEVDALSLRQALINLIENAIKFSSRGGTVTVGLAPGSATAREVRLSVTDEGPGISREEQGKIFERFYRADNGLRRETSGAGIGLSLVKHIVDAHRGRVEVESEEGKGSCFTIVLENRRPETE